MPRPDLNELTNHIHRYAQHRGRFSEKNLVANLKEIVNTIDTANCMRDRLLLTPYIGEAFIYLLIIAHKHGLNIEDCVQKAYDETIR